MWSIYIFETFVFTCGDRLFRPWNIHINLTLDLLATLKSHNKLRVLFALFFIVTVGMSDVFEKREREQKQLDPLINEWENYLYFFFRTGVRIEADRMQNSFFLSVMRECERGRETSLLFPLNAVNLSTDKDPWSKIPSGCAVGCLQFSSKDRLFRLHFFLPFFCIGVFPWAL